MIIRREYLAGGLHCIAYKNYFRVSFTMSTLRCLYFTLPCMRKTLLLFFLFFSRFALAQTELVDSLQAELKTATADTTRIRVHTRLAEQYFMFDLPKATHHSTTAAQMAARHGMDKEQARALNVLGVTQLLKSDYEKALATHMQALKLREQINDTVGVIASYINIGNVYYKSFDQGRAVQSYKTAAVLAEKIENKLLLSKIYNNLGSHYENGGDYKQALYYLGKAGNLKLEVGDKAGYGVTLHHLGTIKRLQGKPHEALVYLRKAEKLNEELHSEIARNMVHRSFADTYKDLGDYKKAEEYAQRAYKYSLKTNSPNEIAVSLEQLHDIAYAQNDYKMAYEYLGKLSAVSDSLLDQETEAIIANLTAKFESEKKEFENQQLLADKAQQEKLIAQKNLVQALGLGAMLLLGVLVVLLYLGRKRVSQANMQLQAINQQVQNQNSKISNQKDEIQAQALTLQQQNRQLEQANEFRNKVFSIISHDLRSPFASIKMMFNLAKRKPLSEQELHRFFDLLGREVDLAMNLLGNLLVWAKAQLNGSTLNTEPLDIYLLAEENLQLMASQAEAKQITLHNFVPRYTMAQADRERLNFVLRNLLMNALKFSFEGGSIRVQAREQAEEVWLAVQDSGKGISEKHLKLLFTDRRFTTAGTHNEKGTGLGLMLCKDFAESINGHIWVESQEGQGATFWVAVPKAEVGEVMLPA